LTPKTKVIPEIYISYAWEKQDDGSNWPLVVKKLHEVLIDSGFTVHIDINNLKYKDNIKSFMQELGKGKYIIAIISEKYMKSKNCMYEVLQMLRYPNFKDRIFPILISDAKIYDSSKILEYLKYWEEKIDHLSNEAKTLSNIAYAAPIVEDIEIMNDIRRSLAKFGDDIGTMNVLSHQMHTNSNFKELIESITKKYDIDKNSIDLTFENISLKEENLKLRKELGNLNKKLLSFQEHEIEQEKSKIESVTDLIQIDENTDSSLQNKDSDYSISDFNNFIGLTKESLLKDAQIILGKPEINNLEEKYPFNNASFGDMVKLHYYKKSKKILSLSITGMGTKSNSTIEFLKAKGIEDSKIEFLGKHEDYIFKNFGKPLTSNSNNYTYRLEKLWVTFICYEFNDHLCNEISIHFGTTEK